MPPWVGLVTETGRRPRVLHGCAAAVPGLEPSMVKVLMSVRGQHNPQPQFSGQALEQDPDPVEWIRRINRPRAVQATCRVYREPACSTRTPWKQLQRTVPERPRQQSLTTGEHRERRDQGDEVPGRHHNKPARPRPLRQPARARTVPVHHPNGPLTDLDPRSRPGPSPPSSMPPSRPERLLDVSRRAAPLPESPEGPRTPPRRPGEAEK